MATYQTSTTDYRGRRHARLTRSMKNLPAMALKVLSELRYQLPDGATGQISNAELARRTKTSEGYISACVRWLAGDAISYMPQFQVAPAHAFITRQKRASGGYDTTMLAPPELRTRAAPPPVPTLCPAAAVTQEEEQLRLWGDHGHDPLLHDDSAALQCGEPPQTGDHAHDPRILLSTCTDQEEEGSLPAPAETPEHALRAFLFAQPALDRGLAIDASTDPIGTLDDFKQDLAAAAPKQNPLIYVVVCWRNRRRVVRQEAPDATPSRPTGSPARRPGSGDRSAYRTGTSGGGRTERGRRTEAASSGRLARYAAYLAELGEADESPDDCADIR